MLVCGAFTVLCLMCLYITEAKHSELMKQKTQITENWLAMKTGFALHVCLITLVPC